MGIGTLYGHSVKGAGFTLIIFGTRAKRALHNIVNIASVPNEPGIGADFYLGSSLRACSGVVCAARYIGLGAPQKKELMASRMHSSSKGIQMRTPRS